MTAVAVDTGALRLAEVVVEPQRDRTSRHARPHPGESAHVAVHALLAALRGRLPLERLLRLATVDVVERVRAAARTLPESLVYSGVVRHYHGTRPMPNVAELVVVVQSHDAVVFLAIEMRWWGFARQWVVAAVEFGWPPDTHDHRLRMHGLRAARRRATIEQHRGDVTDDGVSTPEDVELDRRMAAWQRWDGLMSTTTFTVTVVHRSDAPVTNPAEAIEGMRAQWAFGGTCTRRTETLTGPALAYVLRRAGQDAGACDALPR